MAENNRNLAAASLSMTLPLSLGWVSGKQPNPFAIIADASGSVLAKALGQTGEEAQQRAIAIIRLVNLAETAGAP